MHDHASCTQLRQSRNNVANWKSATEMIYGDAEQIWPIGEVGTPKNMQEVTCFHCPLNIQYLALNMLHWIALLCECQREKQLKPVTVWFNFKCTHVLRTKEQQLVQKFGALHWLSSKVVTLKMDYRKIAERQVQLWYCKCFNMSGYGGGSRLMVHYILSSSYMTSIHI